MTEPLSDLATRPLMTIEVAVGVPTDLGVLGGRGSRVIPIIGGTVGGAWQGRVLPGGADWQDIRPDGTIEIRARYVLELEQGLVEVRSDGLRHAAPDVLARLGRGEPVPVQDYYFRTAMTFRTSAEGLSRLNTMLAVATGERLASAVHLRVFEIL